MVKRYTTKVRIYPTNEQKQTLAKYFGCVRRVYNDALALCIQDYTQDKKSNSYTTLCEKLVEWKQEFIWLKNCDSQALQQSLKHLDKALKGFFAKRTKFPKFKSRRAKQSLTFPQRVSIENGDLKFPKLGIIKSKLHRPIKGKIKTVTVTLDACGHYYASILSETSEIVPDQSIFGKILGIDLGLKDFITTSEGESCASQKKYRKLEHKLAKFARIHSKKQKKDPKNPTFEARNREKSRIKLAKCSKKARNQRQDDLHKISKSLVDENQVIVVETLKIKNMIRNRKLSKSIHDAGWSSFVSMLDYKCIREGKVLIKVDPFFASSKICNQCGNKKDKLELSEREWECVACGSVNHRDINAAKNIRDEGVRILKNRTDGASGLACGDGVRLWFSKATVSETGKVREIRSHEAHGL